MISTFRMSAALIMCCAQFILIAQNGGMNKKYPIGQWGAQFNAVIEFDGDIVVIGQHPTDSSGLNSVIVLRLDTLGEIKSLDLYKDPTLSDLIVFSHWGQYRAIERTPDGGIVIAASMLVRNNLFIIKLNSNLKLEFFREYECDYLGRFVNDIQIFDNHYYVFGYVANEDQLGRISVEKISPSGNLVWAKLIGATQFNNVGGYAIVEDLGFTVLTGDWYSPTPQVPNTTEQWTRFLHIDTSGILKWEWRSSMNETGGSPGKLCKKESRYYYLTRPAHSPQAGQVWWGAQMVCRDSLFNIEWVKDMSEIFYLNWLSDLVLGPDGYLYATGQIWDEARYSRVYKIDPEQGDIVWEAKDTGYWYPNWGSVTLMESLALLESGSVVAVGYTKHRPTGYDHGLLLKVTKDGCIDTLCTTSRIEEYLENQRNDKIIVYPNPATDYLVMDMGESHFRGKAEIFSMDGKRIQSMDVRNGPNVITLDQGLVTDGLHIWTLASEDGQIIGSGKVLIQVRH